MNEFKVNNPHDVERWCSKVISPRAFWLHNKIGGKGWVLSNKGAVGWHLQLADKKQALMAILRFSDK